MQKKNLSQKKMEELLEDPSVISWRALMSAYHKIYKYLESRLHEENYTIPRFQLFFYLYFEGPHSSIELAKKLNVTRGNISSFTKRLEQDLLIKIAIPEGRGGKAMIHLTESGKKDFERHLPAHIARVISLMPPLSKASLESLKSIEIPQ